MNIKSKLAEASPFEGRTPQACHQCRKSKTKCSGTRPQCRRCTRRKSSCSWPRTTQSLGVPETRLPDVHASAQVKADEVSLQRPAQLPVPGSCKFPEPALLQKLLDIFYDRHHDVELCSFLHKPTTDLAVLQIEAPFLAASIISLSALYIPEDEARSHFGFDSAAALSSHFAQLATSLAHGLSDSPSILSIQANLVLAIRELIYRRDFKAWMHAGTAIRAAQALRLGSEYHHRHSPRQREIRRRTFWACFVVDRLLSYSCNHTYAIDMLSACARLPCPDSIFSFDEDEPGPSLDAVLHPSNQLARLSVTPFYITMVRLWGDMALLHTTGGRRRMAHAPTDPDGEFYKASHAIAKFAENVPAALHWSGRNYKMHQIAGQAQAFINFNFLLQHARCVMNQEYLPQLDSQYTLGGEVPDEAARRDAAGLPLEYANREIIGPCMEAINVITDMAISLHTGSGLDRLQLQSTVAANALMTAAAVHLWVIYTQSCDNCPKDVARAKFLQLLQIIQSWKAQWPIGAAWSETLGLLYKLYEYSYGTEPVPDFVLWEEAEPDALGSTTNIRPEEEPAGQNGDHQELSCGDGLPDPSFVCQRLYDKVREILVHPLHATEVKKQNLRTFSRTLWRHMWLPDMSGHADFRNSPLDDAGNSITEYTAYYS